MEKDFVNAPHWSIQKWMSVLAKGGGQKKRFQYCLYPNYPHQFLHLVTVHLTRHLFLVFVRTHNDVSHDIGSSVCARHLIHVSCACVFNLSSTLSSHSSFVSPIFYFILLNFDFHPFFFHVVVAGARSPVHFAQ